MTRPMSALIVAPGLERADGRLAHPNPAASLIYLAPEVPAVWDDKTTPETVLAPDVLHVQVVAVAGREYRVATPHGTTLDEVVRALIDADPMTARAARMDDREGSA